MASGGLMDGHRAEFPTGLKVGDFIQLAGHFSDVYFEVVGISPPADGDPRKYWSVDYLRYDKYASEPSRRWSNSAGDSMRSVIAAEMAMPAMMMKKVRFHSQAGQYDPIYGFAPRGRALRLREAA